MSCCLGIFNHCKLTNGNTIQQTKKSTVRFMYQNHKIKKIASQRIVIEEKEHFCIFPLKTFQSFSLCTLPKNLSRKVFWIYRLLHIIALFLSRSSCRIVRRPTRRDLEHANGVSCLPMVDDRAGRQREVELLQRMRLQKLGAFATSQVLCICTYTLTIYNERNDKK